MKRCSGFRRGPLRDALVPGLPAVAVCLASLLGLAGGCLNPRPEELPSAAVIEVTPSEDSEDSPETPGAPQPGPSAGDGDYSSEEQPGDDGESADAPDAGAPDGGLSALECTTDVDCSDSPADEQPE